MRSSVGWSCFGRRMEIFFVDQRVRVLARMLPGSLEVLIFFTLVAAAASIPVPGTGVRPVCVHEAVQPASVPRTIVSYGSPPGRRRSRSARHKNLRMAVHLQAEAHGLLLPEEMVRLEDDLMDVTRHLSRILSVVQVSGDLLLERSLSQCCLAFWPPHLPNGGRCARLDKRYTGETCLGMQIPETHLRGFSLWPESGEPIPVRHDGSGVPDADIILYVQVVDRPRCRTGIIAYGGFCQLDQNNRPVAGAINFCPNMLLSTVYDRQQMLMGAASLPSSHWEARTLYSSIMTAAPGPPTLSLLDPLTLAALEDTGWYRVTHHAAQVLLWGKGQGHDFGLTSTCDDPSSRFFCLGSGSGCHHWHKDKGFCETDVFLEGCRVYKPFANGSECWKEENARISRELIRTGEAYGAESRCFFANLSKEQDKEPAASPLEGRCYRHRCQTQGCFDVMVGSSPWITCPQGNTIEVPGYKGILECPEGRLCLDTQPLIFGSAMSPTQAPLMDFELLSHNASGSAEIIWTGDGKRLPVEKPGDVVALVVSACAVWIAVISICFYCWWRARSRIFPREQENSREIATHEL